MSDLTFKRQERSNPALLGTLQKISEELREICSLDVPKSQLVITMNHLFVTVEELLSLNGLTLRPDGSWDRQHWGYPILEQLSLSLEDCKDESDHAKEHLLVFVEERLVPSLLMKLA